MDLVVVGCSHCTKILKYIDFGPKKKKKKNTHTHTNKQKEKEKEKEHNHHFNDLFSLWSVITKRTKS